MRGEVIRTVLVAAVVIASVVGAKWAVWRRRAVDETPTECLRRRNRQMMEDVEPW